MVQFTLQHVIVVSGPRSLRVQLQRQLIMFLCQLKFSPAMIQHSCRKTETLFKLRIADHSNSINLAQSTHVVRASLLSWNIPSGI